MNNGLVSIETNAAPLINRQARRILRTFILRVGDTITIAVPQTTRCINGSALWSIGTPVEVICDAVVIRVRRVIRATMAIHLHSAWRFRAAIPGIGHAIFVRVFRDSLLFGLITAQEDGDPAGRCKIIVVVR
ncbi:hypothetical protein AOP6_1189 [Desulfuromonas sp. AOP6]|nr:hypothetical protein AOP6_1189 [Desulfuromonas sp. AOP6]